MFRNLREEIQTKADTLEEQGYVSTAKWCRRVSDNLGKYADEEELSPDLEDIIEAFRIEFLARSDFGDRELRRKCLASVQAILEWGIRKGPILKQAFLEALPLLNRSMIANKPINNVARVFSRLPESDVESRIYGSLFVFMLHIDGQYSPRLKTLCAIKLAGDGEKQAFKRSQGFDPAEIKKCLGVAGEPLLEIYERDGRHLRNAIAHAHFEYSNDKLTCWDEDIRTHREVWRKELSIEQLNAIIVDLYSINHAYMYWYVIRELIDKITVEAAKGFRRKRARMR